MGYRISGGIAHEYDADQQLWNTLDVPSVCIAAFSPIRGEDLEKAFPLVEEADLTVLCSFPIGSGNEGNLELAKHARRLIILKAGQQAEPRVFFTQSAQGAFSALAAEAEHMDYGGLCEVLEAGKLIPYT